MNEREIVEVFISLKKWPTSDESKDWSRDMFGYFQKRWELIVDVNKHKDQRIDRGTSSEGVIIIMRRLQILMKVLLQN